MIFFHKNDAAECGFCQTKKLLYALFEIRTDENDLPNLEVLNFLKGMEIVDLIRSSTNKKKGHFNVHLH